MDRNGPSAGARLWAFLADRYVPPSLIQDPDKGRRLQLVIVFTMIALVSSSVRALILAISGLHHQAAVMAVLPLATAIVLVVTVRSRSTRIGGNLFIALYFVAATNAVIRRGGLETPFALVFSAFPVLATFLDGRRAGAFWLGLGCSEIVLLGVLQGQGLVLVDQLGTEHRVLVHAAGAIIFASVLFVVSLAYEATRQAALTTAVGAELAAAKVREEARMGRVERMAAVGQLAAGVAHEVNNPLAYVSNNITFVQRSLRGDAPLSDEERRALIAATREALVGVTRIGTIVRDLKTFVRDREGDDSLACDVGAVLGSVLRLTEKQSAKVTEVEVEMPDPSPWVLAAEAKLAQVLLNLVLNALQAFGDDRSDNRIDVVVSVEDAEVVIQVIDNGQGMSAETLARATEPFFTTKPVGVGTGLGLSVCKNIIESQGGTLEITSEIGEGTTVAIVLTHAEPDEGRASHVPAPMSLRGGRRILVVDDDPLIRRSLRRTLVGHAVVEAENGKAALAELVDGEFDVVLCDLMMPELSGLDLYEQVARDQPALADRFVFLTGGVYAERERAFLESSAVPVLEKPIDADTLEGFVAGADRSGADWPDP